MSSFTTPSRAASRSETDELSVDRKMYDSHGLKAHLRELYDYRYLLQNLVVRDLKVRYKNSVLGILWSMLNPLILMLIFTLIFGVFSNDSTPHFHIFILIGLLPWNFFSGGVVGGANSLLSSSSLVKKVYFPREILPTAIVFSSLVNFLISLVLLVVFLYQAKLGLTIHALWVPYILLMQIIFMLGLAYLLSAAHVFYRDIAMILDVGMLAWFFLTPIFYPLERFQPTELMGIAFDPAMIMRWANPMASLIDGYRTVLWGVVIDVQKGTMSPAASMDLAFIGRTSVTCILTFIVGYAYFRYKEPLFGEKI